MKLIDLYVKIANGELPKKIIFKNELYILKKWENIEETDYVCESTGNFLGDIYLTNLNEKVQIVEDTTKEYINVSEEQVLFNNLSYEEQQFILKQMRILQPPKENKGEINE